MNFTAAIFLVSDAVRAIQVSYEPLKKAGETRHETPDKLYTYKTMDPSIEVGDFVVVETSTRHEMTVCKVETVDIEPDLDATYEFKWIVGKVDREDYVAIKAKEDEAILIIQKAEKQRRRREMRVALQEGTDLDLSSLPIANGSLLEAPKPQKPMSGVKTGEQYDGKDGPAKT